jgi:hypothetical protein
MTQSSANIKMVLKNNIFPKFMAESTAFSVNEANFHNDELTLKFVHTTRDLKINVTTTITPDYSTGEFLYKFSQFMFYETKKKKYAFAVKLVDLSSDNLEKFVQDFSSSLRENASQFSTGLGVLSIDSVSESFTPIQKYVLSHLLGGNTVYPNKNGYLSYASLDLYLEGQSQLLKPKDESTGCSYIEMTSQMNSHSFLFGFVSHLLKINVDTVLKLTTPSQIKTSLRMLLTRILEEDYPSIAGPFIELIEVVYNQPMSHLPEEEINPSILKIKEFFDRKLPEFSAKMDDNGIYIDCPDMENPLYITSKNGPCLPISELVNGLFTVRNIPYLITEDITFLMIEKYQPDDRNILLAKLCVTCGKHNPTEGFVIFYNGINTKVDLKRLLSRESKPDKLLILNDVSRVKDEERRNIHQALLLRGDSFYLHI